MTNLLKITVGLLIAEIALVATMHGSEHQKHVYALLLAAVYLAGIGLAAAVRHRRKPAQRQPTGWTVR